MVNPPSFHDMSNRFSNIFTGYSSVVLSLFRVIFGLLFMLHGTQMLFDWPIEAHRQVEVGEWPGWWAGQIELVLGLLISIGLFTRPAAFVASGQMAVAYFWMHWPPLQGEPASFWPTANGGEAAVMFCFAFLLLAAMGAGAWSIDAARRGSKATASYVS